MSEAFTNRPNLISNPITIVKIKSEFILSIITNAAGLHILREIELAGWAILNEGSNRSLIIIFTVAY
jgi:hypothetical protein